jgi:hypothetical protein
MACGLSHPVPQDKGLPCPQGKRGESEPGNLDPRSLERTGTNRIPDQTPRGLWRSCRGRGAERIIRFCANAQFLLVNAVGDNPCLEMMQNGWSNGGSYT